MTATTDHVRNLSAPAQDALVDLVVRTFSDAPPATPFLYVGSMGFVEVGVREGSAAALLGVEAGAPVEPVVTS